MSYSSYVANETPTSLYNDYFKTPLEYSFVYLLTSGLAFAVGSSIAIPLLGIGAATYVSAVAVKLNEKYDIYLLKVTVTKCCELVGQNTLLRTVLLVATVVAGHWIPIAAVIVAVPVAFASSVYEIRNDLKNNY